MKKLFTGMLALVAMLVFTTVDAAAYKVNDNHTIYGYGQIWALVTESADNATEGSINALDGAAEVEDTAFGFQARRLRLGLKGTLADGMVFYNLFVDGADSGGDRDLQLLDYWAGLNLMDGALKVKIGRYIPVVVWEVGKTGSAGLKNIERSMATRAVNSAFYPLGSNGWRDEGVEIAYGNMKKDPFAASLSISNGLGASSNVGGDVKAAEVRSNAVGDAAYVLALAGNLMEGNLQLHTSFGMNSHSGAYVTAAGAGVEVDRSSVALGAMYKMMEGNLWFDFEYAAATIGEDDTLLGNGLGTVDATGGGGYEGVNGFYVRGGYFILPGALEAVLRYETMNKVFHTDADDQEDTGMSLGLNYYVGNAFKTQVEYSSIAYDDVLDLEDATTLRLNFQVKF